MWKYVDDLTLGENRLFNQPSLIQEDLDNLSTWADDNKLALDPANCRAMQVYLGKRTFKNSNLK